MRPSGGPICGWSFLIDLAAHSDMASRVQPHEQRPASPAEQLLDDLVARWSGAGGIVRPRALTGLMTSSNAVGCSTGMSLGLAPLRILSA
jgi:hypothetical protein